MKSDERTISALSAQAHNAEADKRTLQKKLAASERRVQDLEKRLIEQQAASDEKVRELTDKLSQEMSKVNPVAIGNSVFSCLGRHSDQKCGA